jgi:hypothetical protein
MKLARALLEIKKVIISITIVDSLIESLIVFLVAVLFLTQFEMSWGYAVVPAIIYYVYRTMKLILKRDLVLVESKVPELNEKLRTAADNIGRSNEIIDSLNRDVLGLMRKVKTSYFISFGGLLKKVIVLFIVSIIIIFVSALNVKLIDLKNVLDDIRDDGSGAYFMAVENESELITNGDIYGDEEIIELGKEELDLEVNLVASDINIDEFKETEYKEFSSNFPGDIGAIQKGE